jgi:hypothetical protein
VVPTPTGCLFRPSATNAVPINPSPLLVLAKYYKSVFVLFS